MNRPSIQRVADIAAVSLVLIAAWEGLSLLIGVRVLPSPLLTVQHMIAVFGKPSFLGDLAATGQACAIALFLAMCGGVALGLLFGGWRAAGNIFEPWMHVLVAIPKVTLYPVILLLFGLGDAAKIAFGVLHGLPTVAIMTAGAIRSLKPIYLRAALTMRLTPRNYALRVLLPAVTPEILASLRICFAFTLLGVLVGEMFASTHGLGHLLMQSIGVDDMPTVMVIVVVLFLFAGAGSFALLAIINRVQR
jgi:NitT/TauT family transport system permease protein